MKQPWLVQFTDTVLSGLLMLILAALVAAMLTLLGVLHAGRRLRY